LSTPAIGRSGHPAARTWRRQRGRRRRRPPLCLRCVHAREEGGREWGAGVDDRAESAAGDRWLRRRAQRGGESGALGGPRATGGRHKRPRAPGRIAIIATAARRSAALARSMLLLIGVGREERRRRQEKKSDAERAARFCERTQRAITRRGLGKEDSQLSSAPVLAGGWRGGKECVSVAMGRGFWAPSTAATGVSAVAPSTHSRRPSLWRPMCRA